MRPYRTLVMRTASKTSFVGIIKELMALTAAGVVCLVPRDPSPGGQSATRGVALALHQDPSCEALSL